MNILKETLEAWNDLFEIIISEDTYEAGFNEGYKLAIDEGSSTAYNDGFDDGFEDGQIRNFNYGWH